MIEIKTSYALDDSCQMRLWARGHYPWGAFMDAVEAHLKREDRNDIPRWVYTQAPVTSVYQRCVPCRDSIVSGSMYVYSDKPGRGASPVTVLDFWFPLHRYFQQDAEKADAEPEWIDDPHDIEQGMMRNPKYKAQPDQAMVVDAQAAFADWSEKREVWPRLTHDEIFNAGWQAACKRVQPASGEDARDANRYHWCRSRRVNFVDDDHATLLIDDDLDAAIDAAMQQERQP